MSCRCSDRWGGVTRTSRSDPSPRPPLATEGGEKAFLPRPLQEGGPSQEEVGARGDASPHLWVMAAYGFVAGLPLSLSGFTFRLWLSEGGVSLAVIGLTANIGLAYSLKFLWSPVLDQVAPPGPMRRLGRRRGWLVTIQPALALAAG